MAPCPLKRYTIDGSAWNSQHLEVQHDSLPLLWINANNKYGPWKDPYVTIHSEAHNGEIVAAAKMGAVGWKRDFRIFLGNPDCTDLGVWPVVKCNGKWSHEYLFSVDGQEFAWRRTRDKQLGALKKGHRDFKLVALAPPVQSSRSPLNEDCSNEKCILDLEIDEMELPPRDEISQERVLAIYAHDPTFRGCSRKAQINFFEHLPWRTELWCLAAVMGLQEKISKSQQAFMMGSIGYAGGLRPLGNYI